MARRRMLMLVGQLVWGLSVVEGKVVLLKKRMIRRKLRWLREERRIRIETERISIEEVIM